MKAEGGRMKNESTENGSGRGQRRKAERVGGNFVPELARFWTPVTKLLAGKNSGADHLSRENAGLTT